MLFMKKIEAGKEEFDWFCVERNQMSALYSQREIRIISCETIIKGELFRMNTTDQRNQKATQKFCIKNCEDASQQ